MASSLLGILAVCVILLLLIGVVANAVFRW